jgi:hypothetical protein
MEPACSAGAFAVGAGTRLSGTASADADADATDGLGAGPEAGGDGCVPVQATRTAAITARLARVDRTFMRAP